VSENGATGDIVWILASCSLTKYRSRAYSEVK